MGMYNEVYKTCPTCGGKGIMQITQIVLGFGCFDLDNPESITSKLNENEVRLLVNEVKENKWF